MKRWLFYAIVILTILQNPLSAQGIQVKTVPILACDQFAAPPSFRDDMGGVTLALRDAHNDIWSNPALFMDLKSHLILAPRLNHWNYDRETSWSYYSNNPYTSLEETASSNHLLSLPAGMAVKGGRLYGAGLITAQSVGAENTNKANFEASNYAVSLRGGALFPAANVAFGLGFDAARIHGVDGVYLLYPDATRLTQRGWARSLQAGLAGWRKNGDLWQTSLGYHQYHMKQTAQAVENKDENEGWYGTASYTRALSKNLDVALAVAYDWKHHPKIPDYPLAGIPRDPGNTRGLNIGLGCSWREDKTLAGFDIIYEPIDVKTWADAAADEKLWDGRIIRKGDVTVRNDYQFHNLILRGGAQIQPLHWLSLRTGSQVRFYSYDYYQNDFIQQIERRGKPQRAWTEFTWTGGASVHLNRVEIAYSLRLLMGTGILERQWLWRWMMEDFANADFIIPPTVQLNVTPVTYYTQVISLRYAL